MQELIFKDEVYRIVGAAMAVYNELSHGFLEPVYQEALALEMGDRQIPHQEQVPIHVFYKGRKLDKEYRADYVAFEEIIIEIKVLEKLTSREDAQLINYLKATKKRLGLLLNFGNKQQLEWKRIIN